MQLAVSVTPKEASHKTPLTLPTSVDIAEIKNSRKGKKASCVTCVGCGILDPQLLHQFMIILIRDAVSL